MARIRTIKPEFWVDEKLTECSRDARLLFAALFNFVDDMGRMQYTPRRLRGWAFPLDDDVDEQQIEKWIKELAEQSIVKLYTVDKIPYLWIPHFLLHQKIDRPTHSSLPAYAYDRNDCQCLGCKIERGEESNGAKHNRVRVSVPAGTPRVLPERSGNRRVLDESSQTAPTGMERKGRDLDTLDGKSREDLYIRGKSANSDLEVSGEGSGKDRRTESAALDEIARGILTILKIHSNSLILDTVTSTVRLKAKAQETSYELAGQRIAARAASLIQAGTIPENWQDWLFDARYDYVRQGDRETRYSRLVCGGTRCSEGWESVTFGDHQILRRCPDCVKLWGE